MLAQSFLLFEEILVIGCHADQVQSTQQNNLKTQ